jgi:2-dehydropantoate 2-reductase
MEICVFGAGAIGSAIGGRMARAGHDITVIARGEHSAAIAQNGLNVTHGADSFTTNVRVAAPAEAGTFDIVFVTLKAHQIFPNANDIARLLSPHARAIFVTNGIPWWYLHGLKGQWEGLEIPELDPDGVTARAIGVKRTVGAVIQAGAEVREPGSVTITSARKFSFGTIDGQVDLLLADLAKELTRAELPAEVSSNIREDVWIKLQGNGSMLPITALTCLRNDRVVNNPMLEILVKQLMGEIRDVAHALGIAAPLDPNARFEMTRAVGASKSSMLQDLERDRELEVEALTGALTRLARIADVKTPVTDVIHALITARAEPLKQK